LCSVISSRGKAGAQQAPSSPSLQEGRSLAFKFRTTTGNQNTWKHEYIYFTSYNALCAYLGCTFATGIHTIFFRFIWLQKVHRFGQRDLQAFAAPLIYQKIISKTYAKAVCDRIADKRCVLKRVELSYSLTEPNEGGGLFAPGVTMRMIPFAMAALVDLVEVRVNFDKRKPSCGTLQNRFPVSLNLSANVRIVFTLHVPVRQQGLKKDVVRGVDDMHCTVHTEDVSVKLPKCVRNFLFSVRTHVRRNIA
jgi:hypothetical protein